MAWAGWAWIGVDTVGDAVDAVQHDAKTALCGWLYILPAQSDGMAGFHSLVREYNHKYFNLTGTSINPFAANLYDAVFLFAHAATRMLAAGGDIGDGALVVREMKNISFVGIQQRLVDLDENGDAIEPYSVMNLVQGEDGELRGVVVGGTRRRALRSAAGE